ncbi:hypothetical protein [Microlunatus flavus]|uniref:Uncharacterized protein n=1 Tax=Microlunatus flavus TaxID=1036181 RepID=A0A1H9LL24_9ACTN|nr:hypothetical protein [Microlunatus flavus]SER12181.1 hypothetical protein SAMN05421756_1098 [Microlunatus flavus]
MMDTIENASNDPSDPAENPSENYGIESDDAPETFPRSYVEKLRTEAKEQRVKASRADYLATEVRRLAIREATRGLLADPSVLSWSDEFEGEDGLPDHDALRAAAEALADAKPWLARPRGDVGQGRHSTGDDAPSLSALLRG